MRGKMLFSTPEQVEKIAQEYFSRFPRLDETKTPEEKALAIENQTLGNLPTLSGLCLKLGFCDIRQFNDYEQKKRFSSVFRGLRTRLLSYWESLLASGRGSAGVNNWLSYVSGGEFCNKTAENQGVRGGSVAVVVIGSDGSRQTLADILQAQNPPQIQSVKTIDAKAQEVKTKSPHRIEAGHKGARTKTLKKLANPHK